VGDVAAGLGHGLFESRTDRHPVSRLGTLEGGEGACSRCRNSLAEVVARVDKKEVKLTILASAILVGVPLIANAIHDLLSGRWDEHLARRRPPDPADAGEAAPHLRGMPIEQLAADLRRLRVAVATDHPRSATHQLANRVAYDHLLMQACEMLDVPHDLGKKTAGRDRDIERIRVEAELERAGIVLSAAGRSG
jgi:hypothetical protein